MNARAPRCTISTSLRPFLLIVLIGSLAAWAPLSLAQSTFVIEGVEGELAQNIRLLVPAPPEREDRRQFKRYLAELPDQVVSAMSAYGYYAANATVSIAEVESGPEPQSAMGKLVDKVSGGASNSTKSGQPQGAAQSSEATEQTAEVETTTQITINVTPNAPVTIQDLTLDIADLEQGNADFASVRSDIRTQLAKGKIFVSADYEAAKASLLGIAQQLGYFDFEFTDSQVKVSRRQGSAVISLQANAGERYSFGETIFQQRNFSRQFMRRWSTFDQGDPYQATHIGELTQNLQGSGYFSSVRVRPLVDPRYGKTVPVAVDLTLRDENQVAIGLGYSTDTKLRTRLTWGKPLLNSNGHSAEWGASLARDVQSASFAYRIPRRNQPLYNFWGIEYGLKNEDDGDTESFLSTLNFQRASRTRTDWNESFFIRWERERFTVGGVEQTTDLVLPGFSYSRVRSKGEPFATWGQSINFQLMGGSQRVLSTIDFLKVSGRFRYLRAVSDRNTIIATAQFGAIQSNDYNRVPASQRFFAGGDRTVRGFAYKDISPRNPDGEAVGGRFLEVLNLEYNYRFRDRWSAAVFVDGGRAFNDVDTGYSVGAGFGVRWQSPVGPFRIDIAIPISDDDDSGDVRVHLSLGPDL